jgi:geranylgeranyl pyrophosphate synthase
LDDWIGIWGDPGQTGKSDSDDLRQGKKTYPVLLGLQESPAFASAWSAGGRESADIAALQASLASAGVDTATRDLAGGYTEAAMNALRASQGVSEALAELESLALRLLHRDR